MDVGCESYGHNNLDYVQPNQEHNLPSRADQLLFSDQTSKNSTHWLNLEKNPGLHDANSQESLMSYKYKFNLPVNLQTQKKNLEKPWEKTVRFIKPYQTLAIYPRTL